jgi:hypothetical protein
MAHIGEEKIIHDLVGKPEGKRLLGRSKHTLIPHFPWELGSKTPTKSKNPQVDRPLAHSKTF